VRKEDRTQRRVLRHEVAAGGGVSTKEGRHFTSAPEEYSAPPLPDDRKALNDLTKPIPYLFCSFYSI
jgi:hypothetical protein